MRPHGIPLAREIAIAVLSLVSPSVGATTAISRFAATITIQSSCQAVYSEESDLGSREILSAELDARTAFAIQCTSMTPYNVGFNGGLLADGKNAIAVTVTF